MDRLIYITYFLFLPIIAGSKQGINIKLLVKEIPYDIYLKRSIGISDTANFQHHREKIYKRLQEIEANIKQRNKRRRNEK